MSQEISVTSAIAVGAGCSFGHCSDTFANRVVLALVCLELITLFAFEAEPEMTRIGDDRYNCFASGAKFANSLFLLSVGYNFAVFLDIQRRKRCIVPANAAAGCRHDRSGNDLSWHDR